MNSSSASRFVGIASGPPDAWCPWVVGRRRAAAWTLEVVGETLTVIVAFGMAAAAAVVLALGGLAYVGALPTRAAGHALILIGLSAAAVAGVWLASTLAERLVLGRPPSPERGAEGERSM